jgi:hypothetical protein
MMPNIHLDEQVAPAHHEELLPEADPVSELREAALGSLGLSELIEQCVRQMSAYRRGEPSTDAYGVELLRRATIPFVGNSVPVNHGKKDYPEQRRTSLSRGLNLRTLLQIVLSPKIPLLSWDLLLIASCLYCHVFVS